MFSFKTHENCFCITMQVKFKLTIFYFFKNTDSFLIYSLMIMFPFTPPSKNKRIQILESSWDFTGLPNQRKTKRGRRQKKQLTQRLCLICPVLCPVLRPVLHQHQREMVHQIQATMQGHDVDEMCEQVSHYSALSTVISTTIEQTKAYAGKQTTLTCSTNDKYVF